MAQFYSLQLGSGAVNARTYPVPGVGLGGRTAHHARAEFTTTAALAAADIVDLFDLPPRARVIGGLVKSTDMDTNGTQTIAFNIGITGTPALFFAATVAAQAGTVDRTLAVAGTDYVTTGKTRVKLVVSTGPATGVAVGTVSVILTYFVEEPA